MQSSNDGKGIHPFVGSRGLLNRQSLRPCLKSEVVSSQLTRHPQKPKHEHGRHRRAHVLHSSRTGYGILRILVDDQVPVGQQTTMNTVIVNEMTPLHEACRTARSLPKLSFESNSEEARKRKSTVIFRKKPTTAQNT
eukprot:GHVU01049391.1.p2 GENE.GHVU01049391.1~~GHVU01049391.1.p2  ORF type:complete len:137 (-),score=5.20 GHVU01049391.1:319-729(-)